MRLLNIVFSQPCRAGFFDPMDMQDKAKYVLPTNELRDDVQGYFVNGDAKSQTKSLSDRDVASCVFRSVFSDVISGETEASSLF